MGGEMTYTHDELRDTADALDRLLRDVVPMLRYAAEDRETLAAERAKVRALRAQLERFASVNVLALMDALGLTGEETK